MTITTDAFWHFSLAIYQNKPAQQLLLASQDHLCVNINLALFCLYLNQQKVYLNEKQLHSLDQELLSFSQEFTQTLRALRVDFKQQQSRLTQYNKLREHLLNAELILEQQEQTILVSHFQTFSESCLSPVDNLQLYQSYLACQDSSNFNSTLKISDLNQYIR